MPSRPYCFIWDMGCAFQRLLYLAAGPDAQIGGFSGKMQIRPEINSDTVIVEISTENNRMEIANGEIAINVPDSVTIDTSSCTRSGDRYELDPMGGLPFAGKGKLAVFDVKITSPGGVVSCIFSGDVVFSDEVTR